MKICAICPIVFYGGMIYYNNCQNNVTHTAILYAGKTYHGSCLNEIDPGHVTTEDKQQNNNQMVRFHTFKRMSAIQGSGKGVMTSGQSVQSTLMSSGKKGR